MHLLGLIGIEDSLATPIVGLAVPTVANPQTLSSQTLWHLFALGAADILVSQTAQTPFSCIGHLGPGSSANSSVFKLFSSKPLEEQDLGQIFEPGFKMLVTKSWRAYPRQGHASAHMIYFQ